MARHLRKPDSLKKPYERAQHALKLSKRAQKGRVCVWGKGGRLTGGLVRGAA